MGLRAGSIGALAGLFALRAWAIDSAGRISWASRQAAGSAAGGSGGSPLRALAVGLFLGLVFAAACLWARRPEPSGDPQEVPPE